MEIVYLCINEEEKDEIVKQLEKEKKIYRVFLNSEKMMFINSHQVKYIVKECQSINKRKKK